MSSSVDDCSERLRIKNGIKNSFLILLCTIIPMPLKMLSHTVSDIFTAFNKHLAISHEVIVLKSDNKFTLQHYNYFKRSDSLTTALKMGLKTHMDNMHSIH